MLRDVTPGTCIFDPETSITGIRLDTEENDAHVIWFDDANVFDPKYVLELGRKTVVPWPARINAFNYGMRDVKADELETGDLFCHDGIWYLMAYKKPESKYVNAWSFGERSMKFFHKDTTVENVDFQIFIPGRQDTVPVEVYALK